MPNKTIYVSDGDVRLFERAQELNGGNLSAAIAEALQRYVAIKEAAMEGYQEITVRVGRGGARRHKRFFGRRIARWRHRGAESKQQELYTVYRTRKDRYAVHRKVGGSVEWSDPDTWFDVETRVGDRWAHMADRWAQVAEQAADRFASGDWWGGGDYTLDVYDTLEDLAAHTPPELAEIVRESEQEPEVETLDI
jgi:EXLDI family protein